MRLCDKHDNMLRGALGDRGLSKFIACDLEDAHNKVASDSFEPLVTSIVMICSQCFEFAKDRNFPMEPLMAQFGEGEVCPICFLAKNCGCRDSGCMEKYESVISVVADIQLDLACRQGLVAQS